LIGATSIASAADLPARTYTKAPVMPVQVFNWTGFYSGGFVGGAFDDRNATATDPSSPAGRRPDTVGVRIGGRRLNAAR
jgi:outer membrane immunogenic protein